MSTVFEVLFIVVIVVAVIFTEWKKSKEARRNMTDLATELGLKLDVTGIFLKTIRLTGEIRGKAVEVYSYGVGRRDWVCITVRVSTSLNHEFSLEPRAFSDDVVAWISRKKEQETDDANFDSRLVLQANRPNFIRAILLPEIRQKIIHLVGDGSHEPTFKLENARMQYSQEGHFSRAGVCVRISESAELLCDLADAIEVGAELQK